MKSFGPLNSSWEIGSCEMRCWYVKGKALVCELEWSDWYCVRVMPDKCLIVIGSVCSSKSILQALCRREYRSVAMSFSSQKGRLLVKRSGVRCTVLLPENWDMQYHYFCSRGGSIIAWFLDLIYIYIYMRFIKVDYFALITKYKLSNCSKSKPKKESTQNGICLEIITSDYRLLWNGRTCCSQLASHVLFYSMTKTCFSIFNWYGNEYTSTISNGDNVLGYTSK